MTIFQRVPISSSSLSLPVLGSDDMQSFESGVDSLGLVGHWLMPTLTDIYSQTELVEAGSVSTASASYVTKNVAYGNYIDTLTSGDSDFTACMLIRSTSSGLKMIFGNLSLSDGMSLYYSSTDTLAVNARDQGFVDFGVMPLNEFHAIVISMSAGDLKIAKDGVLIHESAATFDRSSENLVFGNSRVNAAGWNDSGDLDLAELLIYDQAFGADRIVAMSAAMKENGVLRGL